MKYTTAPPDTERERQIRRIEISKVCIGADMLRRLRDSTRQAPPGATIAGTRAL